MKPLLNSEQICEYLGISYRRFLRHTREDPTFPARKVGGEWKADPDELQAWFRSQPGGTTAVQNNVVSMPRQKRRGRPPQQLARLTPPPGGWQIVIPD